MNRLLKNLSAYERVLRHSGSGILFQQPWWLNAVAGKTHWTYTEQKANGKTVDALPYVQESRFGFQLLRPPLLTPYLPNFKLQDSTSLGDLIAQLPRSAMWIIPLPPLSHEASVATAGSLPCKWEERSTYLLDLKKSTDDIWNEISKQKKRHIHKSEKHLDFIDNQFDVAHFVRYHRLAFRKKEKKYPYTHEFLERVIAAAVRNNAVFTAQALRDQQVIAQIACFFDHHTMYYLLGSFDPQYQNYNAMSGLMYRSIRKAKGLGLSVFDFEGSSDPGIALFFSQFGAELFHYPVLSRVHNPLWKLKMKVLG